MIPSTQVPAPSCTGLVAGIQCGLPNKFLPESFQEHPVMKRFRAIIHGRVQRVGFRFFACQAANDLNVAGYVRNMPDGTVEVVAEGEDDALECFLRLLSEGPPLAHVASMDVTWSEPTGEFRYFTSRT